MHRSTERIITTHVGSLARPTELLEMMRDKEAGKPYDHAAFERQVRDAVADRVHRQVECGTRRRHRRRDGQGQLPHLRQGPPRWVRRGRRRHDPAGVMAQGDRRLSRLLQRVLQEVQGWRRPAQATRVHGTGQLRRSGPAQDRHRQPERGARRRSGARGVPAVVGSERFRPQRALRVAWRLPGGRWRRDARRVPRHRRRRVRAADRRPVADGDPVRPDHRRRHQAARCAGARRRAQPVAPGHPA